MGKWLRGLFWIAGILAVIAGILRATVMTAWKLPDDGVLGASVAPTMNAGDTVLLLTRGTPGFGELVRCPDPEDATKYVVGRIVGLPGDTVDVQAGNLIVNGKSYAGESACKTPKFTLAHPSSGSEVQLNCDIVSMGGGWHYRGVSAKPFHTTKTHAVVGAGMVFLLSDDREFHDDSRDFGALPRESCKERPIFRVVGKGGWSDDVSRLMYLH